MRKSITVDTEPMLAVEKNVDDMKLLDKRIGYYMETINTSLFLPKRYDAKSKYQQINVNQHLARILHNSTCVQNHHGKQKNDRQLDKGCNDPRHEF